MALSTDKVLFFPVPLSRVILVPRRTQLELEARWSSRFCFGRFVFPVIGFQVVFIPDQPILSVFGRDSGSAPFGGCTNVLLIISLFRV